MKWVYSFAEIEKAEEYAGSWDGVRGLMGGKGANLAEMTRIGVPVPPFFTVTTEGCNAYIAEGNKFPEGMWDQMMDALKGVEEKAGKKFGDAKNPLLVSCRSGAKFSMPGMMDTVLNVGLNDETAKGMVELTGNERFVYDSYRRLIQTFGSVVLGIDDELFEEKLDEMKAKVGTKVDTDLTADNFKVLIEEYKEVTKKAKGFDFPQDPFEQIRFATEAVFSSWNAPRAIEYRKRADIADDLGTAVNIWTMVFGNMGDDSGTGVAFTRDPQTGEVTMFGEYLLNAQGEDVVAGIRNAHPIINMEGELPKAYNQLMDISTRLEKHYREMQDVEFTIERGELWLLQTRNGKRSPKASVKIAVDMVKEGLISEYDLLNRISIDNIKDLLNPNLTPDHTSTPILKGAGNWKGVCYGKAIFDSTELSLLGISKEENYILIKPYLKPTDVGGMLASKGIVTTEGGATSHASVVASQFGLPSIAGCSSGKIDTKNQKMFYPHGVIKKGDFITLDSNSGSVYKHKIQFYYPSIANDQTLQEFYEQIKKIDPGKLDNDFIGLYWRIRDTLEGNIVTDNPSLLEGNDIFYAIDKFTTFIQPKPNDICRILENISWEISTDLQLISIDLFNFLYREISKKAGIRNHYTFFRPLANPMGLFFNKDMTLDSFTTLEQIDSPIYQLIGFEFFGINRLIYNFLEWEEVEIWLLVDVDGLPSSLWKLESTNPLGENLTTGSNNVIAFGLAVNGKILNNYQISKFYNELRVRILSWDWYDRHDISRRELLDLLIAAKQKTHIDNKKAQAFSDMGLININNEITSKGSSIIFPQTAESRKERRKIFYD